MYRGICCEMENTGMYHTSYSFFTSNTFTLNLEEAIHVAIFND